MEHSSVILTGDFGHHGGCHFNPTDGEHFKDQIINWMDTKHIDYHGGHLIHDPPIPQNIFHSDSPNIHVSKFDGNSGNLHLGTVADTSSYSNHTEARDNDIYHYNVHSETGPDGHKSNFELTLHGKAQDHTLECHDNKVVEEKDIGCTATSKTR